LAMNIIIVFIPVVDSSIVLVCSLATAYVVKIVHDFIAELIHST